MRLSTVDLSFGWVAVYEGLLTLKQVEEIKRVLSLALEDGEETDFAVVARDLGFLSKSACDRVYKLRQKQARLCQDCHLLTYLLPDQRSEKTSCEHCRGHLLAGVATRELEDAQPGDLAPSADVCASWQQKASEGSLEDYVLVKKLGDDKICKVYLARHGVSSQLFVVRFLNPKIADADKLKRFRRESQVCLKLDHPNIVSVLRADQTKSGLHYMIMEYVEGENLEEILKTRGAFSVRGATGLILGVAEALEDAHGQGVIHRDVKARKILISEGIAKLTDFGLARDLECNLLLTESSAFVGTPMYMVPETGAVKKTDHRADIYCLGLTYYYALTGRHPFADVDLIDIISKKAHQNIGDPGKLVAGLSGNIQKVLGKMLAFDRGDRYQETSVLVSDLKGLLNSRPVSASEAPLWASRWATME
jgi:serine/threonine protein kinase